MALLKILKIVCALVALLFGFLWLLQGIGAGFSAPDWVPPTAMFAAGIYLVLDVFGIA